MATSCMVPVADVRRFERLVCGGAYDGEVVVGACTYVENALWNDEPMDRKVRPPYVPDVSNVLWARVETPAGREAVECFAPSPTLVLGEGAAQTALWALSQPLSRGLTGKLNLRLAHRVGAKKAYADPSFQFAPAGAVLRLGRARPVVVETVSWTGELHGARAVAGGLEDPPDPRAAWKARSVA